ncbi:MAG: hypothetical protein VX988_00150 [Planctomycetota bacterium]|nr:hypothetical protein [Planctomycetota bacterium]
MNKLSRFQRKIVYLVAVAILLFPLYWFGHPRTTQSDGGKLAQLRMVHRLSEARLGKINPAGASMKLATFGLHAFAVNWLWLKAIDYKQREDWVNFDATLEQITHLQPHFVKVWDFQSHNVAFNISVKFDDYRDRYRYVIKGFNLLRRGISYNEERHKLPRALAGYVSLKIGRSDDKEFYRVLFRNDHDYHAPPRDQNNLIGTRYEGRPENLTDCFLVSKWWYLEAERLIDEGLAEYGLVYPVFFHSSSPMQQMNYAKTLEEEGIFDERPRQAWEEAAELWRSFSQRSYESSLGFYYRLTEFDEVRKQRDEIADQLLAEEPGLREKMQQKVLNDLTDEERTAYNKAHAERTPKEVYLTQKINDRLTIGAQELAEKMFPINRAKGFQLADRYYQTQKRYSAIYNGRDTVNYNYWDHRCRIEQMPETVAARKAVYLAREAYEDNPPEALAKYEEALKLWRKVLDEYPVMAEQEVFVRDMVDMIDGKQGYRDTLAQNREDRGRDLPEDFILDDLLKRWDEIQKQYTVGGG